MSKEGWDSYPPVTAIELDDGTLIYPSCDEEGNGPGCLYGKSKDGSFYL